MERFVRENDCGIRLRTQSDSVDAVPNAVPPNWAFGRDTVAAGTMIWLTSSTAS
jgi:hypothetical protein